MKSQWFKLYCELNRLDRDMICDRIKPMLGIPDIDELYMNIVYEQDITTRDIDFLLARFSSGKDKRNVKRLIDKLERLRSQV